MVRFPGTPLVGDAPAITIPAIWRTICIHDYLLFYDFAPRYDASRV
jgi:hypothetical protein